MKDKKIIKRNVSAGLISRVIIVILSLVSKRLLIVNLGSEINGLYSFLVSTIGVLSFSELGFNIVVTYSMYEDVYNEDYKKLYTTYKFLMKIIKKVIIVISIISLLFMPIFSLFTREIVNVNVYIVYVSFLVSIVTTYTYAPKVSLINAHKDDYISTIVHTFIKVLENILQITIILLTNNIYLYVVALLFSTITEGVIIQIIYNRRYKDKFVFSKNNIDADKKIEIEQNVKSILINKLSRSLILMFDSIVISIIANLSTYGKYSNYILIANNLFLIISIFFNEVTSVVGHQLNQQNKEEAFTKYNFFFRTNIYIGLLFYMGFFAISNELIHVLFKEDQVLDNGLVFLISVNYFIMFLAKSPELYKKAGGLFKMDKYSPIIEGVLNIGLSIILVRKIGINGLVLSSIATKLIVVTVIDSFIVYKEYFDKKIFIHWYLVFIATTMFVMSVLLSRLIFTKISISNLYIMILVKGFISVAISLVAISGIILYVKTKNKIINIKGGIENE